MSVHLCSAKTLARVLYIAKKRYLKEPPKLDYGFNFVKSLVKMNQAAYDNCLKLPADPVMSDHEAGAIASEAIQAYDKMLYTGEKPVQLYKSLKCLIYQCVGTPGHEETFGLLLTLNHDLMVHIIESLPEYEQGEWA